jgi:hypothetical protein
MTQKEMVFKNGSKMNSLFHLDFPTGKNIRGVMQVLSLYAANSIFTKGYLTTPG